MSDPGQAFRENPHKKIAIHLIHEAVGPVYGSTGADRPQENEEEGFGRAHYEQHMHVTGKLSIDGETYNIDGYGLRDHSWGPRYWQNILSYRWLTCSFGPELGIMVSRSSARPPSAPSGALSFAMGSSSESRKSRSTRSSTLTSPSTAR